jgi:hypothetical protein
MHRTRGDLGVPGLFGSKRLRRREQLCLKRKLLSTVEPFESKQVTGGVLRMVPGAENASHVARRAGWLAR